MVSPSPMPPFSVSRGHFSLGLEGRTRRQTTRMTVIANDKYRDTAVEIEKEREGGGEGDTP